MFFFTSAKLHNKIPVFLDKYLIVQGIFMSSQKKENNDGYRKQIICSINQYGKTIKKGLDIQEYMSQTQNQIVPSHCFIQQILIF